MPADRPHPAADPPWARACLVVAVLWLVARPYGGLAHDGILYFAQALYHLRPGTIQGDMFFAYGSQDSFSVFARALARLYANAGLPTVQIAILLLCQLALLVATWALLRPVPALGRWLGLCTLAVVSHQYGGHAIFAFAERFLTARSLAEPLALGALWAMCVDRRALAVAMLLLTGLVHPLVAIGAGAVLWCWMCLADRRWAWLALLGAVPLALGLFSIEPFTRLLRSYDPVWWSEVERVSGHVLISTWGWVDASIVATDLGLLLLAARWFPALARLCHALLMATGMLVAIGALGADLLHNQLITQLQLWRVLWLAHLLAMALAPALFIKAWGHGRAGQAMALALAACVVTVTTRWDAGWAFVLFLALAGAFVWRAGSLPKRLGGWWLGTAAAALVMVSVAVVVSNANLLRDSGTDLGIGQITRLAVTMPLLSLPIAAVAIGTPLRGAAQQCLAIGALMGMALLSAIHWDRRPPMVRAIEGGLHDAHPFRPHLRRDAQVLWWRYPAAAWILLERPSFWSIHQGSGILFHRDTAIEFARRNKMMGVLELQQTVCAATAALNDQPADWATDCMPTRESIERLCREQDGPDFLVFERGLPGAVAQWTTPAEYGETRTTWYLYDCLHFR